MPCLPTPADALSVPVRHSLGERHSVTVNDTIADALRYSLAVVDALDIAVFDPVTLGDGILDANVVVDSEPGADQDVHAQPKSDALANCVRHAFAEHHTESNADADCDADADA